MQIVNNNKVCKVCKSSEVFGHFWKSSEPYKKILAHAGEKCHAYELKGVGRYNKMNILKRQNREK